MVRTVLFIRNSAGGSHCFFKTAWMVLTASLNPCPVKNRYIGGRNSSVFLDESVLYAQIDGIVDQAVIFLFREAAAEIRISCGSLFSLSVKHLRHGCVLVHNADENAVSVGFVEIAQDRP